MRLDGSGQQCLTCGKRGVPQMHNGNPTWHASGGYIAFQAQDPGLRTRIIERFTTSPGGGINNNLWVTDRTGSRFWKLTSVGERMGVLHPHFSRDGSRILWAEKVDAYPRAWGDWVIKIAEFRMVDDEPRLGQIIELKPDGLQFFETHGFSPDNSKITFSAFYRDDTTRTYNAECTSFDEFIYDLSSKELTRLTDDETEWDEFAQVSPDGTKIVWMSSRQTPQTRDRNGDLIGSRVKFDYWIAESDGSRQRRLTQFNVPGNEDIFAHGAAVTDFSWSPDSTKIIAKVHPLPSKYDENEWIVVIELE
jgi:Tol biopolymer transport system component